MNHVVQLLLVDARSMDRDRGSVVQAPGADTKRDKEPYRNRIWVGITQRDGAILQR
jgi:hypothetical protein